ncbi:MAG TPA: tripartite tricarboxylate transporter substrate binding protein [Ramlibacter sp.]|uniref:Bug family tripartite tricarboxylate transporter substrate binding protein n=1 Tax=Ramlibacter sp. TaxID=1917967 RepID=UPI002C5ED18B|nr:tripartite tricarboxylate transporter substrate binding protein [Ramlibacter sp.]HVZ45774.1 tripartite tricarboxylate transporter substrate binding protein [Ramlibacter sp.]
MTKLPPGLRGTFAALLLAPLLVLAAAAAGAQELKDRMIRFVNPFAAAGTTDIIARSIAEQITQRTGQKTMVESRAGGGSTIGTALVAHAAPDGTTVLITSNSFSINAVLRKDLQYDTAALEPLCMIVESPQVIAVNASSPYRTLKDLVEAARAQPGKLSFGSSGPGSSQHIAGEVLKMAAGIDLTYVPYPGGAPAITAVLGDHMTSVFTNYAELKPHIDAGKLRPLAVATRERVALMPNLPTFSEQGYAVQASVFFGFLAPPKTPAKTLAALEEMITDALGSPDVRGKLTSLGLVIEPRCGANFRSYLEAQRDEYARVIKAANIKVQ